MARHRGRQSLHVGELAAHESEPNPRRTKRRRVACGLDLVGECLQLSRPGFITLDGPSDRGEQHRAAVTDAWCLEVLLNARQDPRLQLCDRGPAPGELVHLRKQRDTVDAVMRSQCSGKLDMLAREPARLAESTERGDGRRGSFAELHQVIGIADLRLELEASLRPVRGILERAAVEIDGCAGRPGVRP
jgi:hypothetical protein